MTNASRPTPAGWAAGIGHESDGGDPGPGFAKYVDSAVAQCSSTEQQSKYHSYLQCAVIFGLLLGKILD